MTPDEQVVTVQGSLATTRRGTVVVSCHLNLLEPEQGRQLQPNWMLLVAVTEWMRTLSVGAAHQLSALVLQILVEEQVLEAHACEHNCGTV